MSFAGFNVRETINGYIFGNASGFTMKHGEKVRWYTAGMGALGSRCVSTRSIPLDFRTPRWRHYSGGK
jgi:hypothetical protein